MTEIQRDFVYCVKNYFRRKEDREYCATMNRAKEDKDFEELIQRMTIGRIAGRNSTIDKYGVTFKEGRR